MKASWLQTALILLVFIAVLSSCSTNTAESKSGNTTFVLEQPIDRFFLPSSPPVFSLIDSVLTSIVSAERGFIGSRNSYEDFELTLEFWTDEGANSGVYIRCQESGVYSSRSCYEVNVADTHTNVESRTGSIVDYAAPLLELQTAGKWTKMKIIAEGSHFVVSVDGKTTVDIIDENYRNGYIAFQFGGNNKLIKFREIRLKVL